MAEAWDIDLSLAKSRRIIIVGGHDLGCHCFDYLATEGYDVVLCIARNDDEGRDRVFPSLLRKALDLGVPSLRPPNLNSPQVLRAVSEARADIVLSIQNNRIFQAPWIEMFNRGLGIVNAHYAPLPRYGGYWPELWAIWNQERDYGVTLHYVDSGIDTGDIIAQHPVILDVDETRASLYRKCTEVSLSMFKAYLPRFLASRVTGTKQDPSQRTYFKRELPNDGYVDFRWPPETIQRFFRALSFYPFPGPKIRVGNHVISSVDEDLPFFKIVETTISDY